MPKVRAKVDVMYSIRITRELDDELCRVAEAEGRTKTNVIRHYLELGLRVAGKTPYLHPLQEGQSLQQIPTSVINVIPEYSLPIQTLDSICDREGIFHHDV